MLIIFIMGACSNSDSSDLELPQSNERVAFTKKVDVFGVPIYATNTTGDHKLLHAAGVLAQYIDNNEDNRHEDHTVRHQNIKLN